MLNEQNDRNELEQLVFSFVGVVNANTRRRLCRSWWGVGRDQRCFVCLHSSNYIHTEPFFDRTVLWTELSCVHDTLLRYMFDGGLDMWGFITRVNGLLVAELEYSRERMTTSS